ncbi:unnamed protein product [Polarella glacialis]|uniref:Uncharacterized protein n=1 Tax=Polarella glacialis TaxID=89957 RepID=A0A813L8M5_POLGL|nr:unnamed protein product [Polarella glacialis]
MLALASGGQSVASLPSCAARSIMAGPTSWRRWDLVLLPGTCHAAVACPDIASASEVNLIPSRSTARPAVRHGPRPRSSALAGSAEPTLGRWLRDADGALMSNFLKVSRSRPGGEGKICLSGSAEAS